MEHNNTETIENIEGSVRALKSEQSVLSRADGSAIYSQGNTVVMASVFGPLEAKIQKELSDRMLVEVYYKPKVGMPGVPEHGKEHLIQTACNAILMVNLHPRTAITVTIQEMQDAGCMFAAALNATCLALLDSGLPLQCLLAAVTCMVDKNGKIVLDPPTQKLKEGYQAILTFAFDNRKHEVLLSHCEGKVSSETFKKCLQVCRTASHLIFDFYRNAVLRKFSKEL